MTHLELRKKFLDFWKAKDHAEIPSAPLVPENDPSVLFTTAGMHPLVPYLLGQPHPLGKRLVSCQKCLRTDDIDEVGDFNHHTFFEMLGNWSFGNYFKKEAIELSYEFLTKELRLDPDRLYITCFAGDNDAPRDMTSAKIWESLGVPNERIRFLGKQDNWWGPAGQTGPCGPDTEMHYLTSNGQLSEIWNDVFMEYNKTSDGRFEKLKQQNVDTGMGLERTLAVVNNLDDDYLTELWQPAIEKISQLSGKKYTDNQKPFRIIADHIRASVFAISDGVVPSNKQQGYVLRRLIRRSVVQAKQLGIEPMKLNEIADSFIKIMAPVYPDLANSGILGDEIKKFEKTLTKGMELIGKVDPFDLFQTYGFPPEITEELYKEKNLTFDKKSFAEKLREHQELSRSASAGMFKGGLVDHSEQVTKYHTATHLLHAALRKVLGDHVHQEGSNLTAERLRFDFSFPRKLTDEEVDRVQEIVNNQINAGLEQKKEVMTYEEAIKTGALAFFKEKYPEKVTVYSFWDPETLRHGSGSPFSMEICGGPHAENTKVLGKFKIIKEESVSAGVRRIYAVLK